MKNFFLRTAIGLLKSRFRPVPLVLCHRINYECNLRCVFCPYWRGKFKGRELSLEEIRGIIAQGVKMGVIMYNVWGTEPLLRKDLSECLEYAKVKGLRTSVITNGVLLAERLRDIARHLDYLVVSVNGVEDTYQKIHGRDVFQKVTEGLNEVKDIGIKTGINCVVCKLNLSELEDIVSFADDLGFYITFEPVHRFHDVPRDTWRKVSLDDRDAYVEAINGLIEMKKGGCRIANSYVYLRLMQDYQEGVPNNFNCHVGRFLLHVEPDGSVLCPCGKWGSVGSVNNGIRRIWLSRKASAQRKLAEKCSDCLFSGYVESSRLYDFDLSALKTFLHLQ